MARRTEEPVDEEMLEAAEESQVNMPIPAPPPQPLGSRLKNALGGVARKGVRVARGGMEPEEYREYRFQLRQAKAAGKIRGAEKHAEWKATHPRQWSPGPILVPRQTTMNVPKKRNPFDVNLPAGMRAGAQFSGRLLPTKRRSYHEMMGTGYGGRLVPRRRR